MSAFRLYVDEDASESAVIAGLRAKGIDLLTTAEARREGTTDEEGWFQRTFTNPRCLFHVAHDQE